MAWRRELGKPALDIYAETKSVCIQIG